MKKTFKSFITEDAFLSPINRKTMVVPIYHYYTQKCMLHIHLSYVLLTPNYDTFSWKKKRLNVSARQNLNCWEINRLPASQIRYPTLLPYTSHKFQFSFFSINVIPLPISDPESCFVLNTNVAFWTERVTGRACLWVYLRASPERTN